MHKNVELQEKLNQIKDWVLNRVLIVVLFVFLLGITISMMRISQTGFKPLYAIHIFLALVVLGIYLFRNKLSTALRGGIFMGAMYTMAIAGLCSLGLYGFGYIYFIPATAMAFLYFNRRTGWFLTGLSLFSIVSIGFLFSQGLLEFSPAKPNYMQSFSMWLNMVITISLVTIVIALFWNNLFNVLVKTYQTISEQQADLQKMNEQLIVAKEKAEQSDKLKSAFLANISHEIRTPLNIIIGFSGMVAETENPSERIQLNKIVRENCDIMLKLVNDIVDFSKIETQSMSFNNTSFDLQEVLNDLQKIFRNSVTSDVELVIDNCKHTVYTDRDRVFQLMLNLIHNAVKFTNKGKIQVQTVVNDGKIHCKVTDTGVGIHSDEHEKIFHRFYKIDTFSQGAGLGLCLVKWIVKLMHGEVTMQSEPGIGSTFEFSIPKKASHTKHANEIKSFLFKN